MSPADSPGVMVGVMIPDDDLHAHELLGDAADLAEHLACTVAACTPRDDDDHHREILARGADALTVLTGVVRGGQQHLAGLEAWWHAHRPRVLFVGTQGDDRGLAARLAVRCQCKLVSPALSVSARHGRIEILALNSAGRHARQIPLADDQRAIVGMRPGVGQPRAARAGRRAEIQRRTVAPRPENASLVERRPADNATTDIVHLPRLVAGGRGLGAADGFDLLRQVAARLDAGVAASRMAVDLGWIERERQVGQTGKTVHPELYLACGISGASHHREGMSESRHIIALNIDPSAPIFQIAHLGLAADCRKTLQCFLEQSAASAPGSG